MRYLSILILFICQTTWSQVTFYKQFSGTEYDFGQGITQLPDSSYVITGMSGSWGQDAEAFLLKINKNGAYQWSQHYGGNESDEGKRVLWNADLGYFVAGTTNSFGNGDFDFMLMKTALNGQLSWMKSCDLGGWERTNDAVFTKDSGMMVVGYSQSPNSSFSKAIVLRTDKNGDTLWTKSFGTSGQNSANSLLRLNDSLFIVGGTIYNSDSSLTKGYLCQIHENGTVLWSTEIGDQGAFGITDVTMNLNRIHLVGWKWNPLLQEHDNYSGRYEVNGALFYESVFVNQGDVILDELTMNGLGSKLYIGYRNENLNDPEFGFDVTLGRFNTNFDWDNGPIYVNHAGDEKVNQFMPTNDGGAIAVGYITYPMNGGNSIFVMKIGPNDESTTVLGNEPMNPLVGIESNEYPELKVYPNPMQDILTIEIALCNEELILFDAQGTMLIKQALAEGKTTIDVKVLNSGVYFIQIGSRIRKFIKL